MPFFFPAYLKKVFSKGRQKAQNLEIDVSPCEAPDVKIVHLLCARVGSEKNTCHVISVSVPHRGAAVGHGCVGHEGVLGGPLDDDGLGLHLVELDGTLNARKGVAQACHVQEPTEKVLARKNQKG